MNREHTSNDMLDFRIWLQQEFAERSRKNPCHSLRAFSRLLGMEASSVSQILSGKRPVSSRVVNRVCDRLAAPPEIRSKMLFTTAKRFGARREKEVSYHQVAVDTFAVIAD